MRGMWIVFAVGCAVLLVTAAAVSAQQQKGGDSKARLRKNPVAATAVSIAAGKQTYDKQCRHCHGTTAKGDGPLAGADPHPPSLVDEKWDFGSTDGEIFGVIWDGPPVGMKGMKGTLPEKDVWNIVNYLRSLGPKSAKR